TAAGRGSESAPPGRAAAIAIRAWRPAGTRASARVSWARPPVQIGAHARPQLRHLIDRVSADRERAQVEIAGGAGRAPARIFALGGDQLDLDGDAAVGGRGAVRARTAALLPPPLQDPPRTGKSP